MADSTIGNVRYPLVQIAFDSSQAGPDNATQYTLLIGQITTQQPNVIVPAESISQVQAFAGANSMLADMYVTNFPNDPTGTVFLLPLEDAVGSTKAAGGFVITGPATGNGTIPFYVGDVLVPVGVTSGMTAAQMATATVAAINSTLGVPATAAVDGTSAYKVDITANHGGTLGNHINLSLNYLGPQGGQQLPGGVTIAITAMTGGATDPVLTGLAALIGDRPFRFIIHPYSDETSLSVFGSLMSFQGGRWDPTRGSWGHCFTARQDTAANLQTYGVENNDPHGTIWGYETGSPTPPWKWASAVTSAGISSMRGDGGLPPQRPTQTIQVQGVLAPNASNGGNGPWSKLPQDNNLLGAGIATTFYDANGGVYIQRAVTTYQFNAQGQPSQAYLDTEDMYLLMAQSDFLTDWFNTKYSRVLFADTGTVVNSGLPVVTAKSVKADLVAAYTQMQNMGWVQDISAFIAACTVSPTTGNPNGMTIEFTPYNIEGLRQVGITNQFRKFMASLQATAAT
jgi:phage tail sheath gpL-like